MTIVIEAQDRASAQLRTLGQDVQRLERQVESARRSGGRGGGLLGALTGGLGIGAGIGAITQALGGVQSLFGAVGESIFGMNSRLERATAQFTVFTGSAAAAQQIIGQLRREADITPFNTEEVIAAGASLSAVARAANVDLLELVRTAEALAASQPSQGLEGAAFALREAVLGGDFQSIIDRFNLSRVTINRLREEGVPALAAVQAAMREVGATREQLEAFGRTFEGRQATISSFFDELRQRLGAGIFQRVADAFGHMVELIALHGDRLRQFFSDLGQQIGGFVEGVATVFVPALRGLLEGILPGLGASLDEELARVPESIERTAQAAQQAAPAVESVERQLGRLGVQAAQLSLDAERTRRTYDDQIEPLERQLRLLQQSADVQRVQNALATNRATVEGLRLEREITALRRAAGGATDPSAPGLSLRQRLIALALQERELRQEELGLEGERRPLIQSLQQEIARLQEEQRQALAPLERQLELRREEIAVLQIRRQQEEILRQAIEETARASAQNRLQPGQLDQAAFEERAEEYRRKGREFADRLLGGFRANLEATGGDYWQAVVLSFQKWWDAGGREETVKKGRDIGSALMQGAADVIGEFVKQTLFPGGMPRVEGQFDPLASLPRVTATPPGAGAGGTNITINVGEAMANAAGFQDRLRVAFADFWRQFIQSEAAADPGASPHVQGSGRAP